jgi:16S rRNA (guanine(1405)-N(7))-methyltransferase
MAPPIPPDVDQAFLDRLVENVLSSAKYSQIAPDFVRSLGRQELSRRGKLKEAVKAVKNKLHQVGGAYLRGETDYGKLFEKLERAHQTRDEAVFREISLEIMGRHTSTAERLPILDRFFREVMAELPPIHSVLDVACGLNPLAIPWMPLAEDVEYWAVDIYQDMLDFINGYFGLRNIRGRAEAMDVIESPPERKAQVALVLKTIPCLEQVDKNAGLRLLERIRADYLLVSFPAHSLGGRAKGMPDFYEDRFRELTAGREWKIQRFQFSSELVFLVQKGHPVEGL